MVYKQQMTPGREHVAFGLLEALMTFFSRNNGSKRMEVRRGRPSKHNTHE